MSSISLNLRRKWILFFFFIFWKRLDFLEAIVNYEPTYESLSRHKTPKWYQDAKLGIMITWGTFSVPGWAPLTGPSAQIINEKGWSYFFKHDPYAEWYINAMEIDGSPTQLHHEKMFGKGYPYQQFAKIFKSESIKADLEEWGDLFQRSHTNYVVFVTKHMEGYTLWPSKVKNPNRPDYQSSRDFVGELASIVKRRGIRLGLYYSGGYDWTFHNRTIQDFLDLILLSIPETEEYAKYIDQQYRELIERYSPDLLWNDMSSPVFWDRLSFLAYYYNQNNDGCINDRFFDFFEDTKLSFLHHDFTTPEYKVEPEIRSYKWETCRGLGYSFGYNQLENNGSTFLSVNELINSLVDIVSKNGNLLLNVGPMANGTIPYEQKKRLIGLGNWLEINGEGIFESSPWMIAEGSSVEKLGVSIRFTTKDQKLYIFMFCTSPNYIPIISKITLKDLKMKPNSMMNLLGRNETVHYVQERNDVKIIFENPLKLSLAHVLSVQPIPIFTG